MKIILPSLLLLTYFSFAGNPNDSAKQIAVRKSNMRLTTRLHSAGIFNFSGRMASSNPAFDVNFTYDRKAFGTMVFSAVDLVDQHSDNNFTLALLYKRFSIGKKLTVTPNVGFVIEGYGHAIGDRTILMVAYRVTNRFTVDNTSIFANIIEPADHDWVNRIRFMYSLNKHVDITYSVWHNNHLLDHADYLSTGLNVFYNRIAVSKNLSAACGMSALVMTETSDVEDCPKKNGLMITVALTID